MTEVKGSVTIRPATALDAVNIVRLMKQSWEETKEFQVSRVNDSKALDFASARIKESFVAVADLHGRLVGGIILTPCQDPWSDDAYLIEEWWYIVPSFRPKGVGALLLSVAEEFSDSRRVPMLFPIAASDPSDLDAFFSARRGYRRTGGNFVRGIGYGWQNHDQEHDSRLAE